MPAIIMTRCEKCGAALKPDASHYCRSKDDLAFLVTEKATRPGSDKPECFYCRRSIGEHHAPECVLIVKKVRVRMTVDI